MLTQTNYKDSLLISQESSNHIVNSPSIINSLIEEEEEQEEQGNFDYKNWILYSGPEDTSFKILTKTRSEDFKETIDNKLFSSLKYEQQHVVYSNILKTPLLLCKITIEDTNGNIKNILSGQTQGAITKVEDKYIGSFKFQFTDVSCHHKESLDFHFKIEYFIPNNLLNPLIILTSPSFQVFARRPPKKKRKHFDVFESRLEELIKCGKKLNNDERKEALTMVAEKLFNIGDSLNTQKNE